MNAMYGKFRRWCSCPHQQLRGVGAALTPGPQWSSYRVVGRQRTAVIQGGSGSLVDETRIGGDTQEAVPTRSITSQPMSPVRPVLGKGHHGKSTQTFRPRPRTAEEAGCSGSRSSGLSLVMICPRNTSFRITQCHQRVGGGTGLHARERAHGKAAYQCQCRQTQCPSVFHMYLRCLLAPSRWAFPPAGRQYSVSYTNWSLGQSDSSPRWRCPPSPSPAPHMAHPFPQRFLSASALCSSRMMEVPVQAAALVHAKGNMGRQAGLARLRGDRRRDGP